MTATDLHRIGDGLSEARADLLRAIEQGADPGGHLEAAQRYLHTARLATALAAERCEQHHARPAPPDNPPPRRWDGWG
jgi:hypothetical protein